MNSFGAKSALTAGNTKYEYYSLEQAEKSGAGSLANLPFSLKVMLENLLRFEDGSTVTTDDVRSVATSIAANAPEKEIAFRPARVLMQDFTGVPAVVDLATMRDVIRKMGGDPKKINPLQQVDLVIDHSVQVDQFGTPEAFGLMPIANSNATANATCSSSGDKRHFRISVPSRPMLALCIR